MERLAQHRGAKQMSTVYEILNRKTKSWWWHRKLRKGGQHKEARGRERESIKGSARNLRNALENGGVLTHGRGGYTLHCGRSTHNVREDGGHTYTASRVQGYGEEYDEIAEILGIPYIDTRTISDEEIQKTVGLPMIGINKCDNPHSLGGKYTSMSYAPLELVAYLYCRLGATVKNVDLNLGQQLAEKFFD